MKTCLPKELVAMYLKCREHKPFMLVGRDAECSLRAAKTILAFREAESDGLVRMRCEPEQESYFDVFGDCLNTERNGHQISEEQARKELCEVLDRDGLLRNGLTAKIGSKLNHAGCTLVIQIRWTRSRIVTSFKRCNPHWTNWKNIKPQSGKLNWLTAIPD